MFLSRRLFAAHLPACAQDISVANPPTLLLLVDSLLRGLPEPASGEGNSAPSAGVCAAQAEGDTAASPEGCAAAPIGGDGDKELEEFLRKAYPLLDLWMRWLLITQRPGATGWGGQAKGAPLGAFQVALLSRRYMLELAFLLCCVFFARSYLPLDKGASILLRAFGGGTCGARGW